MMTAAPRSPKAEGTIMPATFVHRFSARNIAVVPRLRCTACTSARDDNAACTSTRDDMRITTVSKSVRLMLWGFGPLYRAADTPREQHAR